MMSAQQLVDAMRGAHERARRVALDRADTHINNMLWLHHQARQGRPSEFTMNNIRARYRDARFRVHQDVVRLSVGVRTIFKPVIEVLVQVKGRWTWATYMWLDHEEV